jgi:EmrB/QacA subfamily drug resistance transporter
MRAHLRDPQVAFRRRWYTLLVLCMSLLVIGLDNTILNVALPTLAKPSVAGGLGASGSELQWIVDAYTIVFAGLLLTSGSLGDRFGRYRFLTVGLVIFGTGSALSAFAGSATVLIVTRALMGAGGSCIMPATLSILTNVFTDHHERATAIGIWAGVSAIGIGVGPVAGGALLTHFWWGSVFLVNVPVVACALVLGYLLVPESRDPSAPRLDPLGSVLSIFGLAALLWAVIEGPSHGWTSPEVVIGFVAGAIVSVSFVLWELHTSSPMLDIGFFQNPRFSAASGAITLTFFALFGLIFLLTQYLQSVLGYSTVKAGATLIPMSALLMVLSPLSTRWVRLFGNKVVVAGGLVVVALTMFAIVTLTAESSTLHVIVVTLGLGLGMAHVMAPATESIMGSLPRDKAGVGSAMNDTTRQVGGAVGVAVLGSLLLSTYSSRLGSAISGRVPPQLVGAAKDSVGHALGVARDVPAAQPFASQIVRAARSAFVDGFHVAAIVGACVLLVAAAGVLRWLPARAPSEADEVHADATEVVPMGVTPVDVIAAGVAADLADELAADHSLLRHRRDP